MRGQRVTPRFDAGRVPAENRRRSSYGQLSGLHSQYNRAVAVGSVLRSVTTPVCVAYFVADNYHGWHGRTKCLPDKLAVRDRNIEPFRWTVDHVVVRYAFSRPVQLADGFAVPHESVAVDRPYVSP